ncbi:hypothetical protein KP77_08430 [Jeotgalibacillus alimentarius]|uniref:MFS transporter n=1 Tax=Jeotgalibacillus alimentarius TaxID=135826 RepID=A0A0C2W3Z0_9BACL|nr:hypothetical protein [Jeotgalibacillus alimentarius]KIL51331.1 hypothetical protein KP77_08430 [Jeotgalibacillus alimentarius]
MLKKIFHSPVFNIVLVIGLGLIMLSEKYSSVMPAWYKIDSMVLGIPILILLGSIPIYNRINPQNKIKPQIIPMELREEDEGMQWLTFKATRSVYVFFALIIPPAIALTAYFNHVIYLPVLILTAMGVIQYAIYWVHMRRHI